MFQQLFDICNLLEVNIINKTIVMLQAILLQRLLSIVVIVMTMTGSNGNY